MSSIANKIKEAIHPNSARSQPEGTQGPHSSRLANAADPRIDSDRDGSYTAGNTGVAGTTGQYQSSNNYTHTSGAGEGTYGPHGNRVANAMDPRVDSDRDGSRTMGAGVGTGPAPNTAGPHRSDMLNKVDPRVDSDMGGNAYGTTGNNFGTTGNTGNTRNPMGTTGNTFGTTGNTGNTGTTGNSLNPFNTTGNTGANTGAHTTRGKIGAALGGTQGTGPAPNTAGPHRSDMLNKVDPRVDSDLDGSGTYGANRTFAQESNGAMRDPRDASQVPPSILRQHVGDPSIEHADEFHSRDRRNSQISSQDQFRGI